MKQTPILMCGEMVKATLEGRKTQTRRVIISQPEVSEDGAMLWHGDALSDAELEDLCPYGRPGDLLIVKETHYRWGRFYKDGLNKRGQPKWRLKPEMWLGAGPGIRYCVNEPNAFDGPASLRHKLGWHKRPSIFLPLAAARITLEVTEARVQRVQEISEADAEAEGVENERVSQSAAGCFHILWDSINADRGYGWDKNPWVWAITFRRIKP